MGFKRNNNFFPNCIIIIIIIIISLRDHLFQLEWTCSFELKKKKKFYIVYTKS